MNPITVSPLALANLDRLSDGELGKQLAEAIARALGDILALPNDHKPRKVLVELALTTAPGRPEEVWCDAKVRYLPPGPKSLATTIGGIHRQGKPEFVFNTESAQNPGQLTFADLASGETDG